ncbi:hypothetical protein EDB89DRAFT_1965288 [Lactarius sanguifluus]|nr:hypothetical protein EDB89DRAFT_1965288 [Lactarius sanguifluus]
MKNVFFLAAIVTPLVALAEPEGSPFAELVRRLPGQNLHARSNTIDPSSVSKECQPTCTPIIKTLDACNGVASCECTQANYDALGSCLNCLQALAPPYFLFSPARDYADTFYGVCGIFGFVLNEISITASPTGIKSTGDPFSIFDLPTPTSGATVTPLVTFKLLPTRAAGSTAKTGGAVALSAPRSLEACAVVAVAAIAIFMGGLPL